MPAPGRYGNTHPGTIGTTSPRSSVGNPAAGVDPTLLEAYLRGVRATTAPNRALSLCRGLDGESVAGRQGSVWLILAEVFP